jgi:COMPASS component SWD3
MTPKMYDDETFKCVVELHGYHTDHAQHSNRIFSVKFNPEDNNVLVSGGWDNNVYIYDVRKRGPVASIYGPHVCGDTLDFLDETTLLVGSYKQTDPLSIWDMKTMAM